MNAEKVRRPHADVMAVATELVRALKDSCERLEIAGSLRRGLPYVGDIELVAIPKIETVDHVDEGDLFKPTAKREVHRLWEQLDLVAGRSYTKCGDLYRQFVHQGIKVDLFTASRWTWGNIFLIRTGPSEFSHHVMVKLNEKGYTSRDGVIIRISDTKAMSTPSEQYVFDLAGIPYREPHQRR